MPHSSICGDANMTNPDNWPDPEHTGVPMFPDITARHVLENKRRRLLKLVFWDHEQEHYCTEAGFLTPMNVVALGWEYHGPCLTPTQISEMLVAERERCVETLQKVSEGYRKNAQEIGTITAINSAEEKIEAVDDCWVKIRNLGAAP